MAFPRDREAIKRKPHDKRAAAANRARLQLWNFVARGRKPSSRGAPWREADRTAAIGKEAEMNRLEKGPHAAAEAQIQYLDGDIRVIRPGTFVRCAVTGVPIALDELRYWSVDLQEAYADPEAALKRLQVRRA